MTTRRYEYIYGLGRRLATLEFEGNVPEGQLYYDHHDLLGSPVMRTDLDGAVVWKGDYAPFGETLEEQPVTWGSQYRYLDNEDDGGLMDFGARFYDPRVGRFISPDPIKDVSSANVVNPYVYCMNNPMRYTDRFGLNAAVPPLYKGDGNEGGGGGGFTTSGEEAYDPIPFYGYPIYYGASRNGRQAWIYNNEVIFRAKQVAMAEMVVNQVLQYNAIMAAANALIDSLGNKSFQDTIEALTTYTADAAGAGALIASYDAAMAASEGGFVADVSAVSASAADDIGSAYKGGGTDEGAGSGGDEPSIMHALGEAVIGCVKFEVGVGGIILTGHALTTPEGITMLVFTPQGRTGTVIIVKGSLILIRGGLADYFGSVPEASAAAANFINRLRQSPTGAGGTRSIFSPTILNPYRVNWPYYSKKIYFKEHYPK